MHICYVDESGCTGALKSSSDSVQPLLVVGGLILDAHSIQEVTRDFLAIKKKYFPERYKPSHHALDSILQEIKGSDLRKAVREKNRSATRRSLAFLGDVLTNLESHRAKLLAKIYVKEIGKPFEATAMYSSAMQTLCAGFQDYLTSNNEKGIVIADSRSKAGNVNTAHSIFTQRFKREGDQYNRLLELPVYGNSVNHAGIQLADLLCSAVLFPIAAYSYCSGHVDSVHVAPEYRVLKHKLAKKMGDLQYRYKDQHEKMRGGITVSDGILKRRSAAVMLR